MLRMLIVHGPCWNPPHTPESSKAWTPRESGGREGRLRETSCLYPWRLGDPWRPCFWSGFDAPPGPAIFPIARRLYLAQDGPCVSRNHIDTHRQGWRNIVHLAFG